MAKNKKRGAFHETPEEEAERLAYIREEIASWPEWKKNAISYEPKSRTDDYNSISFQLPKVKKIGSKKQKVL